MGLTTKIAWCDHTWNVAWGCFKVSPGCKNCYADTFATNRVGLKVWGPAASTERRTFGENHWNEPLKWNRRAKKLGHSTVAPMLPRHLVFSSSMCDNFEAHPTVERELQKLWPLIEQTDSLDWLLLTKRPERILESLPEPSLWKGIRHRVWVGTSIESNDYVSRADHLREVRRQAGAAVLFVSYEPALGPLDKLDLRGIDWLIYGGESGPGWRNHDLQWARDIRARCAESGTAFFYKQSAAPRTEMGIELDGEIVRAFPKPRLR